MSSRINTRPVLDVINKYQEALRGFSEEEFCRKPEDGSWSVSEIYCHINQVNMRSLLAVEKCIYGRQVQRGYGVPLFTRAILYFGQFPPGSVKIPDNIAALVTVVSKEDARNELIRFVEKFNQILPKAKKCSPHNRVRHQRLGLLNCEEWIRFIEIYSKYHFKRLRRLSGN